MTKIAYPIGAVSKLTGITIDTLRAWERRYNAIKPGRHEGERVYDDGDVGRLILLRKGVERGHAISKLALLSDKDLQEINERSAALSALPSDSLDGHAAGSAPDLKFLHNAIQRLNYGEIDHELNRLATLLAPRDLIHRVVTPLMSEIGDQWYRGDLTIAQEHMASAALRSLLGSLVRLFTRAQRASALLFATPKGERHEFGILCGAMLSAAGGLGIGYLGIDLPGAEIIDTAQKTKARILVLGVKGAISSKESVKEVQRISEKLPASMELWVGGLRSADMVRELKATRAVYLRDFSSLERELIRVGARF